VSLDKLETDPKDVFVYLDGGLKAPDKFINQETIIKGDELHPVISCASIVAKVARDKIMTQYAAEYPQYGFETNSGYGTATHMKALKKYGLTPIHRKTFIHL
jgi:ribonuclease HII